MVFVYILQSELNNKYYIGSTNNIEERLLEHQLGLSSYTKSVLPVKLVFAQEYEDIKTARKIENKLKRFKNRTIIERIIIDKVIKIKV